jgi:hypothetical protein
LEDGRAVGSEYGRMWRRSLPSGHGGVASIFPVSLVVVFVGPIENIVVAVIFLSCNV